MPVEVDIVRAVSVPTRLVHGPGAVSSLSSVLGELGISRPLLVTDPGVAAAGLVDRVLPQLDGAVVFDEVRPNPDIALVDGAAEIYRESGCDGLVALGGGSSMDTAKAIGVVVGHGGSIAQYEWGHDPIEHRIPPLVAIPTTAGTGSEVTLWAVITDHERKIKFNVGGTPLIGAHVALIDPELMLGLPAAVTAATGMDALSHAIECFTCDYHQPFNDAVALHAIELAGRWLRVAVADGSNLEARTQMAHAAMLGGMAYGTESAGAAHAMSQSAGGVHDCPHGALTARVLGPVCEYNVPASPERYARIAQGLGVDTGGMDALEAALAGVEEVYRLTDDVGIPTMEQLGFSDRRDPDAGAHRVRGPADAGQPARGGRGGLRGDLPQRVRRGARRADSDPASRAGRSPAQQAWQAASAHSDRQRLARATSSTALTMPSYPVQRQRFPESAMRTSSSLGLGVARSRAVAEMSIPGVQKPHWTPPCSRNAACSGLSSPPAASPSIVVTSRPSAWSARYEQAFTGLPSSSIMQAPHSESSQPSFDPVRPTASRTASSSDVPGSSSTG